jgi:hypothetical protein
MTLNSQFIFTADCFCSFVLYTIELFDSYEIKISIYIRKNATRAQWGHPCQNFASSTRQHFMRLILHKGFVQRLVFPVVGLSVRKYSEIY